MGKSMKKSQAFEQMAYGGHKGSGPALAQSPAASSGNRGKYRGGSTGATKATIQLNKRGMR